MLGAMMYIVFECLTSLMYMDESEESRSLRGWYCIVTGWNCQQMAETDEDSKGWQPSSWQAQEDQPYTGNYPEWVYMLGRKL